MMKLISLATIVLALASSTVHASIVTYTIEGSATLRNSSANLLPDYRDLLHDSIPDGSPFTLTFDLELNGSDANPDPDVSDFNDAVSARPMTINGLVFDNLPGTTCEEEFQCRVRATNILFSPTTGVTNYSLNTGLLISSGLDEQLRALRSSPVPVINQQNIGAEFQFSHTFDSLLDIRSLTDIDGVDFNVSRQLIILAGLIATSDNSFGELVYDVTLSDIYTGLPRVSNVPLPAAAWLFATALIGLTRVGKLRKTV